MTAPKKTPRLPNKYKPQFVDEGLRLASVGLPQRDMAAFWGVSEDSVTRWKTIIPEFADALKKGEANRKVSLLKAMYENAVTHRNAAVQIFLAKNWLGMSDRQDIAVGGSEASGAIRLEVVHVKGSEIPSGGNGGNGGNGNKT